jgi:hypothetical protein
MKNRFYKLLLPAILVINYSAIRAEEEIVIEDVNPAVELNSHKMTEAPKKIKPIKPKHTTKDIIGLYYLADALEEDGLVKLAQLTRDTAKTLGDSHSYLLVKAGAFNALLWAVVNSYRNKPDDYVLHIALNTILAIGFSYGYINSLYGSLVSQPRAYGFAE